MKIKALGVAVLVISLAVGVYVFYSHLFSIGTKTPIQTEKGIAPTIEVYFSPHGGCTDAIVKEIDVAKESIYFQAYSFTSTKISNALINAMKRGVKVHGLLDKSQLKEQYSLLDDLIGSGMDILIDSKHAIAHSKIIIIDSGTDSPVIITGSFNFTNQAENSNAENLLVISNDKKLTTLYINNWKLHCNHSIKTLNH